MFIREIRKKLTKGNSTYEYIQHRLVESVRTPNGPRQRTVLNLGQLTIAPEHFKAFADLIEGILLSSHQPSLFSELPEEVSGLAHHFAQIIAQKRLQKSNQTSATPAKKTLQDDPHYEEIDINSVITTNSRSIGVEHIALHHFKELDMFSILSSCSFTEKEQALAAAQICARMAHPASERETARWLRNDSALSELLGADFSHISDQMLHRVADKLWKHRETIEKEIAKNATDIFSLDSKVVLYDLTNTYFESPKRNSQIAKYGRSKEKRNDCPLLTLALIVDAMGFPKRSMILEGNVSEPDNLLTMLEKLEIADKTDNHPRTIVIDAGIATEDNLAKLRDDPRFEYVAISRKKHTDHTMFPGTGATSLEMSHDKELVVEIAHQEKETFLLCKSPDRQQKDSAIHKLRKERFEKAMSLLNEGLSKPRTVKSSTAIHQRIGRIKERYSIGHLYTIEVKEENGIVTQVCWTYHSDKENDFGEYIIRTSRKDFDASQLSIVHRTLTMIEAAFEWLKSDLGLRPNFHQKDSRMCTHATISVLAYFVLAPILHKIQWGGEFVGYSEKREDHSPWNKPYGWKNIVRTMRSQTRVTTAFKCKSGKQMNIRTTVEPTAEQMEIYKRLAVPPRPVKRIIQKL